MVFNSNESEILCHSLALEAAQHRDEFRVSEDFFYDLDDSVSDKEKKMRWDCLGLSAWKAIEKVEAVLYLIEKIDSSSKWIDIVKSMLYDLRDAYATYK